MKENDELLVELNLSLANQEQRQCKDSEPQREQEREQEPGRDEEQEQETRQNQEYERKNIENEKLVLKLTVLADELMLSTVEIGEQVC